MTRLRLSVVILVVSLYAVRANGLTFSDFVTQSDLSTLLSNTATIGFTYAGDKFVGSVYFGANNNQLYTTDLNGGSIALFGTPIPGFSGEIYVSSSLGTGGFGNRDVFAGSQDSSSVYRISNNGTSQGPFVTTGIVGGVRSIGFDPFGLFGNAMVVATNAGNVYTVDNAGTATLLAVTGEDTEGVGFAPQQFGPYPKGTLFVASEGSGDIRAVAPDGSMDVVASIPGAEMLSFVPLDLGASGSSVEGFYSAAYPTNVVKGDASEFVPFKGELVVTDELDHDIYNVRWDGASFQTTLLDTFPAQPEDGIFVTQAIIMPEPSSRMLLAMGAVTLLSQLRKQHWASTPAPAASPFQPITAS